VSEENSKTVVVNPDCLEYYLRDVRHFFGDDAASEKVVQLCRQAADELDLAYAATEEVVDSWVAAFIKARAELNEAKEDIKDLQFQLEGTSGELDSALSRERSLKESVEDLHIGADNLHAEIERLTAERDRRFRDDDFIPRYPDMESVDTVSRQVALSYANPHDRITVLMGERDEAVAERDEARRDVCNMMHWTGFLAGDYANSRGWDCFKDGYGQVSDEILNFRDIWSAYAHRLRDERDEARRYVCNLVSWDDQAENFAGTPHEYARQQGWDCFKETK